MCINRHLGEFAGRLAPLLPADFAAAVRRPRPHVSQASAAPPPGLPLLGPDGRRRGRRAGPLLAPLAALGPSLGWVQNPNYVAAPPSPDFLENYGYAVLAGPGGLVASEELALGVLMLGPGIHYPTHRHPAVEIYVVACGRGRMAEGARRPGGASRRER